MREIEGEGQREGVIERGRQGRHREREWEGGGERIK